MKKKLFATLGALCLGVILCVSSVFAVNWWYSINNDGAKNQTIQFGQAVTLSVENAESLATGVYQGSVIEFEQLTVKAPAWTAEGGAGHTQATLPTFDLVITPSQSVAGIMTAAILINEAAPADGVTVVNDGTTITIQNIQAVAATFTVDITLTVAADLPVELVGQEISFTAAITTATPGTNGVPTV